MSASMSPIFPFAGWKGYYKEIGGLNWCDCTILAVDGEHVWIKNHKTGSKPVGLIRKFQFDRSNPDEKK